VPLTRRKWLEQSDASLISGVGSTSHDPNNPSGCSRSLDDTLRAVRSGDVTSVGTEHQVSSSNWCNCFIVGVAGRNLRKE